MTTVRPLFLWIALTACGPAPDRVVTNEVLTVGCGTCRFHLVDGQGCYWAVELDGEHFPMAGSLPAKHESHAPDGMCNMTRKARITGELRGKNFIASGFELLPPEGVPDAPAFGPDDEHGADYKAPR